MAALLYAVPSQLQRPDILNPKTALDREYTTYMSTLRRNIVNQKADVTERLERMAAHAETSEVARHLRILNSVTPNREPQADDMNQRKPGWLQQVNLPRISRLGDKDEPVPFRPPDDIQNRNKFDVERRLAHGLATALPTGTSMRKNGDLVEGSQDRSDISRPVGMRFPVLARETPKFVNQATIENTTTGFNRSDLTSAVHRSDKNDKVLRSTDLTVNYTGPQQYTAMNHSKTGNQAVEPSFTLRSDDTGAFGDKFKAGGVSQTKRGGHQQALGTFSDDTSHAVEMPASFYITKANNHDGVKTIKFKDDNRTKETEALGSMNKISGQSMKAKSRDDEFTLKDDSRLIKGDPDRPNVTDKYLGHAAPVAMEYKKYELDLDGQEERSANAGLIFRQTNKPLQSETRFHLGNEQLQGDLYVKSQTASKVMAVTDRPDMPSTTRDGRENVDTTHQVLGMRPNDKKSGQGLMNDQIITSDRKITNAPHNSLGAHNMIGGPAMQGDIVLSRNQPQANRDMIRVAGNINTKPNHELDVQIKGRTDQVGVDFQARPLGLMEYMPGQVVVERKAFVPTGNVAQDDNHRKTTMPDRPLGTNVMTTRQMLLAKRAAEQI